MESTSIHIHSHSSFFYDDVACCFCTFTANKGNYKIDGNDDDVKKRHTNNLQSRKECTWNTRWDSAGRNKVTKVASGTENSSSSYVAFFPHSLFCVLIRCTNRLWSFVDQTNDKWQLCDVTLSSSTSSTSSTSSSKSSYNHFAMHFTMAIALVNCCLLNWRKFLYFFCYSLNCLLKRKLRKLK